MHTMEKTPRILTLIGLILEFLGIIGMAFTGVIFKFLFTEELFEDLATSPEELEELQFVINLYQMIGNIMIIIGIVMALIFIVNLFVNIKLMTGKFDEGQARSAYIYQLIIGIVLIFLNTIAGIVYIISGVQGKNNEPDKIHTREGI